MKGLLLLPLSLRLESHLFTLQPNLEAAYLGEGLSYPYYRNLYQAQNESSKSFPLWSLSKKLEHLRATRPVVLVELNKLLLSLLPTPTGIACAWIRHETDLQGERYRHRRRSIEREYGRKVRQQHFEVRYSNDPATLEQFYSEFYLPYVLQRHGETASVRSLRMLTRALRKGFLLQVWQGDQWCAGLAVTRVGPDRVRLLANGLRLDQPGEASTSSKDKPARFLADTRSTLQSGALHDGALSATYYFLFRWALENSVRYVDLCGTRPHLNDGVFRHKTLWAAEPKFDPSHHTAIAFYLDPSIPLPASLAEQLVRSEHGYIPLGTPR